MAKIEKIQISESKKQYQFLCPGCKQRHAFNDNWYFNNDYEKPTVTPSIKVDGWLNEQLPKGICHSFITDGMIQFLSDCSHSLANQTVELLEL